MLTEADMIRIMAAKYNLAESVAEENVENKSHDVLSNDDLSGSKSIATTAVAS